ncbi:MAG: hypothetical protein JNJ54_09980 [Myxococcaceae bacterium]|nr:hypothetical protein [Myxococcaceae bacterium]
MNNNELEKQLAQVQERLAQLERGERPRRESRAAMALVVGLVAGTAMAAVWPANFQAGTPAKAADLNDYLNELNVRTLDGGLAARGVPTGAVMFFNLPSCPVGWTVFAAGNGRTLVGFSAGGDAGVGAGVGAPLPSGQFPAHAHRWSSLATNGIWRTFDSSGGEIQAINWNNGLNEGGGTGYYPFTVDPLVGVNTSYYTSVEAAGMPYVPLTVCVKQ